MEIHIGSHFRTEQLHARVQERFGAALAGCGESIQRVEVRLGGGRARRQDAFCIAQVELVGAPAGTVIGFDSDPMRAVDRAADRARRLALARLVAADREASAAPPPSQPQAATASKRRKA